ncbi:16S rRNA methyltransferase [Jeotgalibacillus campisalis]|uniref:Ribosomal RNA small subunit methyltransferase E n=2 Tax=Jeotgalibacillus campisalis TaxID=220754 RepID=A0A0C2VPX4_9BACL|nr:16S rRNA methyltransferase [Jeotgalibacillus campisalis]
MTNVMRMQPGSMFIAVFKNKTAAECTIVELDKTDVLCAVSSFLQQSPELPVDVTIAHGLPKGDKFELVIQKSTELGAHSFIPFKASRSIVKWDEKKGSKKVERWNKISKEAAEQSHRLHLPEVHQPVSFKELIKGAESFDTIIVAYEEQAKQGNVSSFSDALAAASCGQSILVVVGPEGGLSEQEVTQLVENGAVACGFGPRILRSETAPLYALAAISYQFELMR